MISKPSLAEAVTVLRAVLTSLGQAAASNTGTAGADFTYAASVLSAGAATKIAAGAIGDELLNCFTLAIQAGATFAQMQAVFTAAGALAPVNPPAQAVVAAAESYAVLAMSTIAGATTFTSRDDVDAALAQLATAFDTVQSAAGNSFLTDLFQALVAAEAAVTGNLTATSYPLARLVRYVVGRTMSALTLAQRLYGDPSRGADLATENGVFNPAFMPVSGQALSS